MKIKIQENEKGMNSARPESGPQPRYAGPAQRRKLADRPVPAAPCGCSHRVSMRTWWRGGVLTGGALVVVVACGSPGEQEGWLGGGTG
jgi:hypothetical protein